MLEEVLSRAISLLDRLKVDYMVIGGFALPSYGSIRATVDLDVAVRIRTPKEFRDFVEGAKKSGFEPGVASFSNPVSIFVDAKTGVEVEFWLRPDGLKWDARLMRRRRKARIGKVSVWLVSPEDFIVTKLARPDRGVQDEKDAKGVLVRLDRSLDRKYLRERAANAGVLALLQSIEETG